MSASRHLRWLSGVICALVALPAIDAESQDDVHRIRYSDDRLDVGLEEGETARVYKYLIDGQTMLLGPLPEGDPSRHFVGHLGFNLHLANPAPMIEVGISIEGPSCPFRAFHLEERVPGRPPRDGMHPGLFRRIYVENNDEIKFGFQGWSNLDELYFEDPSHGTGYYECEVTVALSRVTDRCSLTAEVSGDVSGAFFGDVAYFNVYDEPVAAPLDPGMVGLVDELLGMATPPPDPYESSEAGDDEEADEQPQSFADALAEWAAEDPEPTPMSGKFNLSASNVVIGEGDFGGTGLFSFTAVGPGDLELGEGIRVPLTYMTVLPGEMDGAFSGAKFLYSASEGTPGSVDLYLLGAHEQTIFGTLKAELFSEQEYMPQNRRLKIALTAYVIARRGALACQ